MTKAQCCSAKESTSVLLFKTNMQGCKLVKTLMATNHRLHVGDTLLFPYVELYRTTVGALQ